VCHGRVGRADVHGPRNLRTRYHERLRSNAERSSNDEIRTNEMLLAMPFVIAAFVIDSSFGLRNSSFFDDSTPATYQTGTKPVSAGRTMNCQTAREHFGPHIDGELPTEIAADLEQHLRTCPACAAEFDELRTLAAGLARTADIKAPASIWLRIEQRLDEPAAGRRMRALSAWLRRPIAAAASVAILIGLGVFVGAWLSSGAETAEASNIDFSLLLDGLAADVDTAVSKFLLHYNAEPIAAETAKAAAPRLRFAIPPELPGGFTLQQVYRMRFGSETGIAARYRRGNEPLVVFFHPPVDKEHVGVHREMPCIVGGRHGHSVEVGPWRLVHFTDPTTCHCILSTLDMDTELPKVMRAVAPDFDKYDNSPHGHR
jgi:hypothetical protein